MPIALPPRVTTNLSVIIPNAVAGEAIAGGSVVALINVGGVKTYYLCGALVADYAAQAVGFAGGTVAVGDNFPLVSGRGSLVVPVVEGGVPLTPDEPVFISLTPGEVTQTFPPGQQLLGKRVGVAVSLTEMVVNTDAFVNIP